MSTRAPTALVMLAVMATSCVTGEYARYSIDEPIAAERIDALQPGTDDLTTCLRALGAPHRAFEYRAAADGTAGVMLLWMWRDESGWGLQVSSPLDEAPVSFEFDRSYDDLPACALWFGADLRLERARLGSVRDLLPARVRPAVVGDDP
jgi:hypothetical protein